MLDLFQHFATCTPKAISSCASIRINQSPLAWLLSPNQSCSLLTLGSSSKGLFSLSSNQRKTVTMAATCFASSGLVRAGRRASFMGNKVTAASNGTVRVSAKLGNWFPGSDTPAYLENVVGSYGFDPLGLAKEPAALQRYQEAELVHCRWSMLGVAGALGAELLGQGSWFDAPKWAIEGGSPAYLGVPVPFDLATLAVIELVLLAAAESQRGNETDPEKRKYPGGAFDPFGFSKDAATFEQNKIKEIKNGRLAMLAFLGFVGQAYATGKSPLEALSAHVADPFHNNFAENGVSVPWF